MLILSLFNLIGSTGARVFTIEEDEEDAWVGELLSAQEVHVFYPQVEGQFDDRTVLHVGSDVRHQSQVLHQTTRLQNKTMKPRTDIDKGGPQQYLKDIC